MSVLLLGMSVTRTAYCAALTETSFPSITELTPLMWRTDGLIITSRTCPFFFELRKDSVYMSHHFSAAKDSWLSNDLCSLPDVTPCIGVLSLAIFNDMEVEIRFALVAILVSSPWNVVLKSLFSILTLSPGF